MIEISNEIKDKINKLEVSSGKISDKIKEIREKYGEPEQTLAEIDIEPAPIVNTQKVSKEVEKQQEKIEKTASSIVAEMSKYIEKAKEQTRLDLLFIMNITNSMDFYLNQVKQYILKMIEDIQIECAGSEINLGFIGYRDFNDLDFGDEYIDLEFTTDYESIRKRIENVTAQGGGDVPEDLCGALELGQNKKWSGNTRFAILVTDSPCHGEKYHDLSGDQEDNYPDGDREGRNIEDYIKFFSEEKISLYCLKISNTTDKMFNIFEEVYNKSKKENSKNEFVLEEGKKLIDIVTKNAINMFQHRDKLDNF
jgi:myosin protein heavy chain